MKNKPEKRKYDDLKQKPAFYRFVHFCVRHIYPKFTVEGAENLPAEPVILVGNHSKVNGPVACELYAPRKRYTWCIAEMLDRKEVPDYAYQDFWGEKPKAVKWIFRLVSYIIAPLASFLLRNANTIGVYKDRRIVYTFRETVEKMQAGADIVIFPECPEPHNNIVHTFQEGFVDVARVYYRKTGKDPVFTPLYVCPRLRKLVIGKPLRYDHTADRHEEAKRITAELMDRVSELAYEQPPHTVVPYPNIPKRDYPTNERPEK